ncbi:Arginine N-succinyltransferase subunit alpha [Vibrio aerogenes CECT 7868]|uniref:Arginine N-succinyltransferase subunit alpha n=1 Tax=Vibrio aerogenes CECT 7868 TaxID=1216006 RepID=A0A1M5V9S4_9VIBR|nr:arginine N-succinyltransferase [Vibrio aerogenes]SHH72022.1 Arginine N-succinyltransferase subunit alpha [Vibrio aerogenes CECT 7868]
MIILRPARQGDIQQIEQLAHDSGTQVSTLPAQRAYLVERVSHSMDSFRQEVLAPGEENYLFVLEETVTGQILGTGGIVALAGFLEPFYAFRNDILIHSSRALKIHSRIHALTLTHDLSDHSQLCSFYVVPALRDSLYPALVTLGRLMYMAVHKERFAEDWMAVLPGIADASGRAPFWDHVGRKFFRMSYHEVEHYNSTLDRTFIAELMPHHPLYVPLINEEAQAVMGQIHPDSELQYRLLFDQGFEADKYVEIFDAGPILTARKNTLNLWQNIHQCQIKTVKKMAHSCQYLMGMTTKEHEFQAGIIEAWQDGNTLFVSDATCANTPGLEVDQSVWCLPLDRLHL